MAKQFKPETLCVQAGWTPKKTVVIFIPACKTRLMTRLPPRLPPLKVV